MTKPITPAAPAFPLQMFSPGRRRRLLDQVYDLWDELTAECIETTLTLDAIADTMEDLLLDATQRVELANEEAEDIRQAARGNQRVACQWCDGEFYVPRASHGPHTCRMCRHCDGY
ncbi:hypothetical protein [Actinoplanes sp. NPDC051851]|uniref:hypothetical protein n=1 Tax=Actinoplanes sp. NPDC051851 TaxID=3154753 RepID=UPI00343D5345